MRSKCLIFAMVLLLVGAPFSTTQAKHAKKKHHKDPGFVPVESVKSIDQINQHLPYPKRNFAKSNASLRWISLPASDNLPTVKNPGIDYLRFSNASNH